MVISEAGKRVSKIDTYLNCAEVFAYRSTCIKRKYGAVIVKDDAVISTGYNGSPREEDALLNCSREQTLDADLYLTGLDPVDNKIHRAKPCPLCARMIIQAGIKNVYLRVGPGENEYIKMSPKDLTWFVEG